MIQLTPQTRIWVAVEPQDFRKGIDGMARVVRAELLLDPFNGAVYVFRNRRGTAVKLLIYDGQGFWLCNKRLSKGKFGRWPSSGSARSSQLQAYELTVLLFGGDWTSTQGAPVWRSVCAAA